ncbi:hypothetical protein [Streptomyces sp. NBC_01264]|uniref:hypothetical protein n=1 Tax=Streptomyces sp. NBC_01264 TaxID=2903804 RepID=UPI00224EEEEF|nr:hypothetical protein [Streptomyces sp. NBC_01264]MCX4784026.1 hypothetical protein [Streptomyces sp. NBC_01264]
MSSTPTEAPAETEAPLLPELNRGAGILIIVVAFIGTIASTIDVFVNGWLSAVAHLAWFIGILLLLSFVLATLVTLVAGPRGGREPIPLGSS